ncbi:hypothetical protein BBJ28_00021059 [Nothophytophthora sp. Chile5]|nr:hypothetical protein BBJ28_00021059 [Nothophytophthora sp. Chile5]
MPKTRADKIDQMSTAGKVANPSVGLCKRAEITPQLMAHFADEVHRFSRSPMKPDDVLRRFSLNGDGQLDLREFQLAVTRLEIVSSSMPSDTQHQEPQQERALARAKELYLVFYIDLFCRIMTEWSLQLMRARYQHGQTSHTASTSSLSKDNRAVQYASVRAPLAAPYATQTPSNSNQTGGGDSRGLGGNDGFSDDNNRSTRLQEGEALWQRIATPITQSNEKLRQIFLKMDVMSSGKVSPEELELALSHIGVFLTTREYEKLYMSLGDGVKERTRGGGNYGRGRTRGANASAFVIKYAEFIAFFQGTTGQSYRPQTLPSNSRQASPPVVGLGNARLWDFLVAALDRLEPLFQQYERIRQRFLPPETFRDCLLRCGIALSNADFAALRVRLLPFTSVTPLYSKVFDNSFPFYPLNHRGNTNKKLLRSRNAEASRTFVKIRDEKRWKSDLHFPVGATTAQTQADADNASEIYNQHQHHRQDPFFSSGKPPATLEARILAKLQQLKQIGQPAACSPQSIFPGDRFGRISRGQFRQSLVHLGVLARYAEVEALFWPLDPQGRGYMTTHDFYDHLNAFAAQQSSTSSLPTLVTDGSIDSGRLSRSVQKMLEGMLLELPHLCAICERMDVHQTGTVSSSELFAAIQEVGILASVADTQNAIAALSTEHQHRECPTSPPRVSYRSLPDRLRALCSDLLSPKKRQKHLSTTSVLLAPHEDHDRSMDFVPSDQGSHETDALWNCPRRRMHQDHPAAKSSIRITDAVSGSENDFASIRPAARPTAVEDARSRQERRHRLALVGVLQDLLERRSDLKTALDLHRCADARGQVTKQDLVEILLTSRLNLHFAAGSAAARELVDELYPSLNPDRGLGFLEVLQRVSELLAEVTKDLTSPPPSSGSGPRCTFSTNPYQQQWQAERRSNASSGMHNPVVSATTQATSASATKVPGFPSNGGALAGDAASVRRKLLHESRLKELLNSDYGRQSAAILVRHAFKGLAAREMVVPVDNGQFEAMCRTSDIKHVCYRLGLDLDLREQQFVAHSIDPADSGFISSPDLLEFFTQLAQPDATASYPSANDGHADTRRSVTFQRGLPRLKYMPATSQQLASTKDARKMNRVTSGIGGALEGVQMTINQLSREIKADEKGKQDYDDQLFRLNQRRQDMEAKLLECREWSALFESKIKPLAGKYAETTDSMQGQYEDAKLRHAQGIKVLIENFDYHPEFKRFSDTFSAVPFKPK